MKENELKELLEKTNTIEDELKELLKVGLIILNDDDYTINKRWLKVIKLDTFLSELLYLDNDDTIYPSWAITKNQRISILKRGGK